MKHACALNSGGSGISLGLDERPRVLLLEGSKYIEIPLSSNARCFGHSLSTLSRASLTRCFGTGVAAPGAGHVVPARGSPLLVLTRTLCCQACLVQGVALEKAPWERGSKNIERPLSTEVRCTFAEFIGTKNTYALNSGGITISWGFEAMQRFARWLKLAISSEFSGGEHAAYEGLEVAGASARPSRRRR